MNGGPRVSGWIAWRSTRPADMGSWTKPQIRAPLSGERKQFSAQGFDLGTKLFSAQLESRICALICSVRRHPTVRLLGAFVTDEEVVGSNPATPTAETADQAGTGFSTCLICFSLRVYPRLPRKRLDSVIETRSAPRARPGPRPGLRSCLRPASARPAPVPLRLHGLHDAASPAAAGCAARPADGGRRRATSAIRSQFGTL